MNDLPQRTSEIPAEDEPPTSGPRGLSAIRSIFSRFKSTKVDVRDALTCNAAGIGLAEIQAAQELLGKGTGKVGRFEVHRMLGQGGCGSVFQAFDPQLDRWVALKVPLPNLMQDERFRQRFIREGKDMALINHQHVVSVYEAGRTDDDPPTSYIASEYCPGPSLSKYLDDYDGNIDPMTAAQLVTTLAAALHHVHELNVVHRDLKPSNVMLFPIEDHSDNRPIDDFPYTPKLTDFGLAKNLSAVDRTSTSAGMVGTTRYMAPEQVLGNRDAIGPQTDIYGLGVMLYELLAGQLPFQSENSFELYNDIVYQNPPTLPVDVPRDLASICLKCLQKSPSHRYQSARQLGQELDNFLDGKPLQFTEAVTSIPANRTPTIVSAVLALFALVAVGSVLWIGRFANESLEAGVPENREEATLQQPSEVSTTKSAASSDIFTARLNEFLRTGDASDMAKLEAVGGDYPVEWWLHPETGQVHGYQLVYYSRPLDWNDAADLAKQMRARGVAGQLASVTCPEEHQLIVDRFGEMDSNFGRFGIWIGLAKDSSESEWRWLSGEPLKFKRWHSNEPKDSNVGAAAYGIRPDQQGNLSWGWTSKEKANKEVRRSLVEYQLTE